jgi:hypothetical protein
MRFSIRFICTQRERKCPAVLLKIEYIERERVSLDRSTRFDNVSDDLTIGQKKNERPTFGKTNPFEPMEGSIKAISTGAATVRSRKRYGLEHVQTKHRRRYAGS